MICELKNEKGAKDRKPLKVVWDPVQHRSMLSRMEKIHTGNEIIQMNILEAYPGNIGRLYESEDPTYLNKQQYQSIPLFCCSGDMEYFLPMMQTAIAQVFDDAIGDRDRTVLDLQLCKTKPVFREFTLSGHGYKLGTLPISRKLSIQVFVQKNITGIFSIEPVNQVTLVRSLKYRMSKDTLDQMEIDLRYICGTAWEVASRTDPVCHERYTKGNNYIPTWYRPSFKHLREILI